MNKPLNMNQYDLSNESSLDLDYKYMNIVFDLHLTF